MNNYSREAFVAQAQSEYQALSELVNEYDEAEVESDFAQFSMYDPLKNIILGLAAKLKTERNFTKEESLEKADQLTRDVEEKIKKPEVKKKICAALEGGADDTIKIAPAIIPLLVELIEGGTIAIAFDPTGAVLIGLACMIIIKMGIKGYCS